MFGRSDTLAIRATLQEALYDVISSVAYKKRPWEVEVVINARTNNTTVYIVGLIPTNVVHYVRVLSVQMRYILLSIFGTLAPSFQRRGEYRLHE